MYSRKLIQLCLINNFHPERIAQDFISQGICMMAQPPPRRGNAKNYRFQGVLEWVVGPWNKDHKVTGFVFGDGVFREVIKFKWGQQVVS